MIVQGDSIGTSEESSPFGSSSSIGESDEGTLSDSSDGSDGSIGFEIAVSDSSAESRKRRQRELGRTRI